MLKNFTRNQQVIENYRNLTRTKIGQLFSGRSQWGGSAERKRGLNIFTIIFNKSNKSIYLAKSLLLLQFLLELEVDVKLFSEPKLLSELSVREFWLLSEQMLF